MGDIIQCHAPVSFFKDMYNKKLFHDDLEFSWVTKLEFVELVRLNQDVHKVFAYDKNGGLLDLFKLAIEIKNNNFDYIYDAHNNIRSTLLRSILFLLCNRSKMIIRSKERLKRFFLFTFKINFFTWPYRGMFSYVNPVLKELNVCANSSVDSAAPIVSCSNLDFSFKSTFNQAVVDKCSVFFSSPNERMFKEKTVVVTPSAAWPMKRWPLDYWKKLIHSTDFNFVILGGKDDVFLDELVASAPERVVNLRGRLSIVESVYLISKAKVLISADTGLLHAADLFQIPCIALIGPTAFGYPSRSTSVICESVLHCRPCSKDGRGKCRRSIYQECMRLITPEKVKEELFKLYPF